MIDTHQNFSKLQKMNSNAIYLILEGRAEEALESFARCAEAIRVHLAKSDDNFTATKSTERRQSALKLFGVSLDEVIYPFDCSERVSPDNCFRLHRFVYLVEGEE